ncbi:General secretion pathway protein E [Granulibacter bethesdensis]|uniref:General secretion pathway protein E n=1 Tax=Granulibacter bethesdensis TaxID=364410 RepID=A0AAC9P9J0_9PROT|nr:ATPase, T2SS/T4P/T4SS family [Granulibacter bethesdensis]APH55069.1 General secretion pathway protein E [Granulibacter bethesdensis]APH62655.1 General secretion pathway protein E [Granulibacter bethesdensis]
MTMQHDTAQVFRQSDAGLSDTGAIQDRLTSLLLSLGHCDSASVSRATSLARETGERRDIVMQRLGLITERDLAEAYAALLNAPLLREADFPDTPLFAGTLPQRFLHSSRILPVSIATDGTVTLAMADPLDQFACDSVAAALGRPVRIGVAVPIMVETALQRLYPETDTLQDSGNETEPNGDGRADDTERLRDLSSDAPVIRLVNQIISRAVETGASDIHIEPFEDRIAIRYRYDGVLHEAEGVSARGGSAAAITSRIKIMARLDIAERRLPQDGRLKLAVRGQEVDFRVSTVPSLYGETVVMRILDRSAVAFEFDRLGLRAAVREKLERCLAMPNGIVLVTGPTGSGKTTTLYAGLNSLNSPTRKIVTIEDPVEYQLRGINQIQVKPQIGLSFAALLRAILRQDPDVIMVGEVRDLETAQIAAQAALTGHLVLSTLHTNSAAATITRLRDMGLEDYLLTAVLRGVLAQRLVRVLCPACKTSAPAPSALIERFRLDQHVPAGQTPHLWHPVGCPACRQTGYRGRMAIAEFLEPDAAIDRLIYARAGEAEVEEAARAAGMHTMFEAGLDAVLAGETSLEEITRCLHHGEDAL